MLVTVEEYKNLSSREVLEEGVIGVIMKRDSSFVNVVKNRFTGKLGYMSMTEFKEIGKETKEDFTEDFFFDRLDDSISGFLDKVFNSIEDIRPEIDSIKESVLDTVENAKILYSISTLKRLEQTAIKEDVATEDFLKKIKRKIDILEILL